MYTGSLVRVQDTDPELPAFADRASAPKLATLVVAVVSAVTGPVQAVAGADTVQL